MSNEIHSSQIHSDQIRSSLILEVNRNQIKILKSHVHQIHDYQIYGILVGLTYEANSDQIQIFESRSMRPMFAVSKASRLTVTTSMLA